MLGTPTTHRQERLHERPAAIVLPEADQLLIPRSEAAGPAHRPVRFGQLGQQAARAPAHGLEVALFRRHVQGCPRLAPTPAAVRAARPDRGVGRADPRRGVRRRVPRSPVPHCHRGGGSPPGRPPVRDGSAHRRRRRGRQRPTARPKPPPAPALASPPRLAGGRRRRRGDSMPASQASPGTTTDATAV
jgi:hypothetical protein